MQEQFGGADPRGEALAVFLRHAAAMFSMSADETDQAAVASVGMILLDAAKNSEHLSRADQRLAVFSDAGCFESMPDGSVRVVEPDVLHRGLLRLLASPVVSGDDVLTLLAEAVEDLR